MYCYECSQAGTRGEAIGICHHCSVALCQQHARIIADPGKAVFARVLGAASSAEAGQIN